MSEGFGPDERPLVGARFPHQRRAKGDPAGRRFRVVRKGYAPEEVDAEFDTLQGELERLRTALRQAEQDRDEARGYARRLDEELQRLRAQPTDRWPAAYAPAPYAAAAPAPAPPAAGDHGPVADKMLRLARHEALLLRASARQEAADIVERARREAEHARADAERGTRPRPLELPAAPPAPDLPDFAAAPTDPPHPAPSRPALHPTNGSADDDT